MAIAIIETREKTNDEPNRKYITAIPNPDRERTRDLLHKIEESIQDSAPFRRSVHMRDDCGDNYQIPKEADQITYREYLSQYVKGLDKQRAKIGIILSSLP